MADGAQRIITERVTSWEGVEALPHRFGGTEYRLGRREIGHIHDDRLVDIPFPVKVKNELVAKGKARPHHLLPESGWISFYVDDVAQIELAIDLLRQSYDLAQAQVLRRTSPRVE